MKGTNIIKIIIVIAVVILLSYVAIFGVTIGDKTIIKSAKEINTGLDISGGVTIIYQASLENENSQITEDDLSKSATVIKKRLENLNIFDYIVRTDASTNQIYVEIPADINYTNKDPLEAVKGLDKTAKVEFRDPDGNVLLSGTDIKSAKYSEEAVDQTGLPSPHVVLTFSDEGSKKFTEATEKLVGKLMSIYLDEEEISAPTVNSKIESSTAIITMGNAKSYSERVEEAKNLALLIDSGALPVSLNVISKEYVGPYIGQKALNVSVKAGIVALIVIILILTLKYRLSGVVASISLIAYTALDILILTTTSISLTLPGIAGLILSIGMAVDANVIIFERLKEELVSNKMSVQKVFEKSFKNAMSAIIDGNVTTIIVALLLYIFGTGTIKGFGIVLAIGVLLSLFTAIVLTKYILKQFLPLANKNIWLFGAKKEVE